MAYNVSSNVGVGGKIMATYECSSCPFQTECKGTDECKLEIAQAVVVNSKAQTSN